MSRSIGEGYNNRSCKPFTEQQLIFYYISMLRRLKKDDRVCPGIRKRLKKLIGL